ncbi:DNA polymerase III subunit gamma and tau, partial [Streptomyces sp. NPDC060048]
AQGQGPAAGAWPGASAAPAAPAPQAAPAQVPAPAAAAAAPSPGMAAGAGQIQAMWPAVLEAVKNRRRFTWILLSQNAQVAGFDGTTLQLGFPNAGARDNFASSGSEDVLKAVLAEQFQVTWKIEAVLGGGGQPVPPVSASSYGAPPAPAYSPQPAQHAQAPQQQSQQQSQSQQSQQSHQQQAPQQSYQQQPHQQQQPAHHAPPPVAPEDDVPEDDDPDLVDSALSGHELIVRELGATVVEEYTND